MMKMMMTTMKAMLMKTTPMMTKMATMMKTTPMKTTKTTTIIKTPLTLMITVIFCWVAVGQGASVLLSEGCWFDSPGLHGSLHHQCVNEFL